MQTKTENFSKQQTIESLAGLYRLFRRLYDSEIDSEFLQLSKSSDLQQGLTELGLELPADEDATQWLEDIATEFAFLFIGPGAHISPHESVQIHEGGLLNGVQAAAVKKFVLLSGFDFDVDNRRYPDHICSEFEFMEHLLNHELKCLQEYDLEEINNSQMLQQEFYKLHLSVWIEKFCDKFMKKTRHDFYKNLGSATKAFMQEEKNRLS